MLNMLSLAEQFTLRALTWRVIGEALTSLNPSLSLWVVSGKNYICSSFAGALSSTVLSKQGWLTDLETVVMEKEDDAEELEKLIDKDVIYLWFGWESDLDTNYKLTKAALKKLALLDYQWDVFFHVRVWVPGLVEKAYLEDSDIAEFLTENPGLWTFKFDLEKGVFVIAQPHFAWEDIHLHEIKQVPITKQHLDLLKASL